MIDENITFSHIRFVKFVSYQEKIKYNQKSLKWNQRERNYCIIILFIMFLSMLQFTILTFIIY
jgi:hypothetical protein